MDINTKIAEELGIRKEQVSAAVKLIDEGCTIPFIARYRKEATGALSDEILRNLYDRLVYLRNLEDKKQTVLASIEEQGKLTEELRTQILAAETQVAVDDLYRPYRPKRRTRATIAKEKGLEPLANLILLQKMTVSPLEEAKNYVNPEKEVNTAEEALQGAKEILAEAVAGLPLHLYRYKEDGGKEKAIDHPLYLLLHDEPNPEMSSFVFRETLMTHLLLWGNAYAQIIRNGKGEVIALYPLMPDRMTVNRDSNGQLYYEYTVSMDDAPTVKGSLVRLQPSDVLHIPGLGFDGLVGYSPIAMAKNAIGMAIACEEYGAKFFANGAAPGGVLEHPGTIKDPQRVRESWQSTFGGSGNANKIAVLEEGMKYTPIGISPEQAQFLETRKFQINEIARIFRVPPHMVGDLEKSSFSNIEQQSLEFVKYTLDPWVIRWEQSIQRSLLSKDEKAVYFVKFNLEGLLRGDYQSRMNGYAIGRQNGWMSANDIRELENLDRIPAEDGGDLYLINGNMLPLKNAGAFANTPTDDGKEEKSDEEILELEDPNGDQSGDTGAGSGEDAVSERDHRRGKLV